MNYKDMEMAQLEERKAAIAAEAEGMGSSPEDLDGLKALEEEMRTINEEIEARKAAEAERRELAEKIANGSGEVINEDPSTTEERKTKMDNLEVRNSREYIDAFANYIKTGSDAECRALLSDGAATGTVPIPEFVAGIVADRVRESRILSRVRKVNAPGVLKVGFEINAPEATYHAEGAAAVTEEALTLGIVTMNPASFKKWVSFSDELMDNSQAFIEYIYDEITRGIIKAEEKAIIQAILAAPQTATATAPAVAKTGAAAGEITDFVNARALLSGAAEDLVVIVSPAAYATYRGLQMGANYGVDPFDGREVIISEYATVPIIGDLYGVTLNRPKGDEIEFKLDNLSLMTSDIVRLLGRQAASVAVTGNLFFAKVSA